MGSFPKAFASLIQPHEMMIHRSIILHPAAKTASRSIFSRSFASTNNQSYAMGVTREVLQAGDGKTFPKKGDHLVMHYQ
jgi:FKBP-type peptidyl-prolyl cis-trans isomerase